MHIRLKHGSYLVLRDGLAVRLRMALGSTIRHGIRVSRRSTASAIIGSDHMRMRVLHRLRRGSIRLHSSRRNIGSTHIPKIWLLVRCSRATPRLSRCSIRLHIDIRRSSGTHIPVIRLLVSHRMLRSTGLCWHAVWLHRGRRHVRCAAVLVFGLLVCNATVAFSLLRCSIRLHIGRNRNASRRLHRSRKIFQTLIVMNFRRRYSPTGRSGLLGIIHRRHSIRLSLLYLITLILLSHDGVLFYWVTRAALLPPPENALAMPPAAPITP